jgi:ribA/ribD-fused uncharacterized protein
MKYDLAWLKQRYDSGVQPKFLFFAAPSGDDSDMSPRSVLSQWYPSAFSVQRERYTHAAHWMMVQKAKLFGDESTATELLAMHHDDDIRERGRKIDGFEQRRWNEHRYGIVLQGNLFKFSQHPALRTYISATHPLVLTEANPGDQIWGIGLREDSPEAGNPHSWLGLNLLGFALMEVRDQLINDN